MMIYTTKHFCEDLGAVFFPPKFDNDEARERWYGVVKRKLKYYSGDHLLRAAEYIVSHRKARSFPSVAEMLEAVHETRERDAEPPEAPAGPWQGDAVKDHVEWTARWEKLMDSPPDILKAAAQENYHSGVKAFFLKNKRLPNANELGYCKSEAKLFLEAYEDCVRGGFPNAAQLLNLGDAMLKAREQERNRILGT
jgi:hypothetical protein